jgi:hypothetical protein
MSVEIEFSLVFTDFREAISRLIKGGLFKVFLLPTKEAILCFYFTRNFIVPFSDLCTEFGAGLDRSEADGGG